MMGGSMKASAKQPDDQPDPAASIRDSVTPRSEEEQICLTTFLEKQYTNSSLIEDWIDA
jgi:hypothetical protein